MDIGKLNRRIQIQSQTPSQDAAGQELQSWSTIYTCWAEITIQKSQLIYSTAEFISKVVTRVTMRWTSSVVINPSMRIVYTEATTGVVHTYEIQAVLNTDQRNRELILMAYELDGVS